MPLRLFISCLTALGIAAAQTAPPSPDLPPANPPAPTEATDPPAAAPNRVTVLGYHDFSETLPETEMRMRTSKFRRQMESLRQLGITAISYDEFCAWKRGERELPGNAALITLDDGWKSVYTEAFPILKEYGYPFVLYLYRNYVDGGNKALTTAMIRDMQRNGATIGCHSTSHPYPATVRRHQRKGPKAFDTFLRKEIGESKRFLEARFKTSVKSYAFPGGFTTPEMPPILEEFAYTHAFTVKPGKVTRDSPDLQLPRHMVLGTHDRTFDIAVSFAAKADRNPAAKALPTAHPVTPEPGSLVNSRTPRIAADLSKLENIDPASLTMTVSGFGRVPATLDPRTMSFSWQTDRRLRQPQCSVEVRWRNKAGSPAEDPLRWSFRIDLDSAYLLEDP